MENRKITSYSNYIEGNAVRKIKEVPASPVKKQQDVEKKSNRQKAASRNRQKELRMSPGYVLFLTMITVVTAYICVQYISLQSRVMTKNNNIIALEENIDSLIAQNDAVEYTISSYIDTANIIKVATNELGMVKASQSQISFYHSTESEYMKQLDNIPSK